MGNYYTVTTYSGDSMALVKGEEIDGGLDGSFLTAEAAEKANWLLDRAVDTEQCFLACWGGDTFREARKWIIDLIKRTAECRGAVKLFANNNTSLRETSLISGDTVNIAHQLLKETEKQKAGTDDDLFTAFEAMRAIQTFDIKKMGEDKFLPLCVAKSIDCYLLEEEQYVSCYF